jgi:hypothetical protein
MLFFVNFHHLDKNQKIILLIMEITNLSFNIHNYLKYFTYSLIFKILNEVIEIIINYYLFFKHKKIIKNLKIYFYELNIKIIK